MWVGEARGCVHHWLIEEATGPESDGVCLLCGERRIFKNWIDFEQAVQKSGRYKMREIVLGNG